MRALIPTYSKWSPMNARSRREKRWRAYSAPSSWAERWAFKLSSTISSSVASRAPMHASVTSTLQNTDVPLLSTDIGYCFAFPDTAACKLDGARQGTTGVCGDCSNLIVMRRHVPEWKRRLVDHDQFRAQMVDAGVWSEVREASWKRQRDDICKVIAMLPGDPVDTA
jgi:hypothetical protein